VTAEIVAFPGSTEATKPVGARDVIAAVLYRGNTDTADKFLMRLWQEGYKIVPVDEPAA